jgi:hypothetical protein
MTDPPARQSKRTKGQKPEYTEDPNLGKRKRVVEVKKQVKHPLKQLRVELRKAASAEDRRTPAASTSTNTSTGAIQEIFPGDIFEGFEEVIPKEFFNSEVETEADMAGDQIFVPNEPMPKYRPEKKLASKEVDLFLKQYEVWAAQRKYDEKTKKLHLPLALENRVAQQWFTINQNKTTDDATSWAAYIKFFKEECPMEDDDAPTFAEMMSMTQKKDEKASIFLQRIRYYFGDQWGKFPEKDIIPAMVKQLTINTRRYVQCRGMPEDYQKLMEIVKEYEEKGGTKDLDKITVKTEAEVSFIEKELERFQKIEEQINQVSLAINQMSMNRGRGGQRGGRGRGGGRGFRGGYRGARGGGYGQQTGFSQQQPQHYNNTPNAGNEETFICGFCKKPGHIKRNCFKLRAKIESGRGYAMGYQNQSQPQYEQPHQQQYSVQQQQPFLGQPQAGPGQQQQRQA